MRKVQHMTKPPELKTSAEVAAALGKSLRTLGRMVERGEINPAMKLPGQTGHWLFTAEELRRAVSEQSVAENQQESA